ncbi:MAG TPA: gamma-glutamyltransferase [Thermoanaerobaculia bacterium]|jgi:gamma-glutamyltranspeptidase/glutathione hydrolase
MRKVVAFFLLLTTTAAFAASRPPLRTHHGMVSSTSDIASRIGVEVMKKGGNAVDAAVAVAFALAVTWPAAGNLGGGGFMLIREADGKEEAVDYRETAPAAATREMYLDATGSVIKGASTDGYKAVAVPGTVAGLALVHKRHGKLPWRELVEPARKLAADGFIVSDYYAGVLRESDTQKKIDPWPETRRIFLRNGKPYAMGERFVQPELAATLARIERDPHDFYEGVTAHRIVADMKAHGGIITLADLRKFKPAIRQPLHGSYRGHDFITFPPPSSGGIAMVQMTRMLEGYDMASIPFQSAASLHLITEVMRRAFADRAELLGDPDFVKMPVAQLLSREYNEARRKTIDREHASNSQEIRAGIPPAPEPDHTTHFAIVDAEGNMVSNTYTLNDWFGAGVTAKGTGIVLNNEMDDFTSRPGVPNEYQLIQSEKNAIEPHKRPLSSMTPVIMLDHGKPWLAIGGAGGPRIISGVFEVIVNLVDYKLNLQEALDAGRIHHQWLPDEIYWEVDGTNPDTRAALERMGHKFREHPNTFFSEVNAVMIDPDTGLRVGAADPRRSGAAAGY